MPKKKRGWATLGGRFRLLTTRWRISIAGVIARWTPNFAASAGEILLKRDPTNPGPAEEALKAAIATAQQQGARSFELRAALSLANLYQATGRPADAHAVLTPALEGFMLTPEMPEMPEIAEAQALLAAVAETDEVRAQVAQRHRLTQLQVSYGNALIAARGFAAPETTEAFARARESASWTRMHRDGWRQIMACGWAATYVSSSCR